MKVLLLENISAVAVEQFRAAGYEVDSHKAALEEPELIEKIRDAEILGLRSKTAVSKAVLESAQKLVAVGAFCIGVDKIDGKAAGERGIAVFNDPHSNSRSVAELAMGEIILLLRRTFAASTEMHGGVWNKSSAGAHEVRGLTLGIVGYGKIGSQLSDLAEAMISDLPGGGTVTARVANCLPLGNHGFLIGCALYNHAQAQAHTSESYLNPHGQVIVCVHCRCSKRVASPERWDFVPANLKPEVGNVTHGLCPICREYFYPRLP